MKKRQVVIIGGGPAGRTLVHMLHTSDQNMSVTLIKDERINANRCAVHYGIPDEKPLEKFQIPNARVTDYGAALVIDCVARIDTIKKVVFTATGDRYPYDDLVLSTGSRPVIPPIPGVEGKNITAVRSITDLSLLRQLASTGKRAVVVGGEYIGIEVAVVLKQMGLDVTVVEMLPTILSSFILKIGGSSIHVGILSGFSIGLPLITQRLFAGLLGKPLSKKAIFGFTSLLVVSALFFFMGLKCPTPDDVVPSPCPLSPKPAADVHAHG